MNDEQMMRQVMHWGALQARRGVRYSKVCSELNFILGLVCLSHSG